MKLLLENWRKYLNENYSQKLKHLRNSDQELRNKWAAKIEKAGAPSKELAAEFAKEHGTTADDLFKDAERQKEFESLFNSFSEENFDNLSDEDWKNLWLTATAYKVNDLVNSGGSVYIAVADHTSTTFGADSAHWTSFANAGTDVALTITTHGDLLYRGASLPERLAPGTSGQLLTSGGAAAAPTWNTPAAAAGFTIAGYLMYS